MSAPSLDLTGKVDPAFKVVREHQEYIDAWCPELRRTAPGLVGDVGCGCGELLEIARPHGHEILGPRFIECSYNGPFSDSTSVIDASRSERLHPKNLPGRG